MTERFENESILTQGFHQNLDLATSVFENPSYQIQLKVYPNPVMDWVTIETETTSSLRTVIYDLYGRAILEKNMTNSKDQMNLSDFSAGTYLLSIYDDSDLIQIFKLQKIGF